MRAAAAVGLSRLQDSEALAVLQELATQGERPIQQQAILGLANYAEETALPPLLELVASEDQAVRMLAFNALSRYKSPKVTAVIVEKAAGDDMLRRAGPGDLGPARHRRRSPAHLGEYLKSDDLLVRRQAEQRWDESGSRKPRRSCRSTASSKKRKRPRPQRRSRKGSGRERRRGGERREERGERREERCARRGSPRLLPSWFGTVYW